MEIIVYLAPGEALEYILSMTLEAGAAHNFFHWLGQEGEETKSKYEFKNAILALAGPCGAPAIEGTDRCKQHEGM